jgi:hypothetical protein
MKRIKIKALQIKERLQCYRLYDDELLVEKKRKIILNKKVNKFNYVYNYKLFIYF